MRCVAQSSAGVVATGSTDRTVRLWASGTGAHLRRLEGSGNEVATVAFSPDGAQVAAGTDDRIVYVWATDSGKLLNTLRGTQDAAAAFAASGARHVAGGGLHGSSASTEGWGDEAGVPRGLSFHLPAALPGQPRCAWSGNDRTVTVDMSSSPLAAPAPAPEGGGAADSEAAQPLAMASSRLVLPHGNNPCFACAVRVQGGHPHDARLFVVLRSGKVLRFRSFLEPPGGAAVAVDAAMMAEEG